MAEQLLHAEPETQPLSGVVFQLYLQRYNLSPLDVALAAGVRYLTIWRVTRALPIRGTDAVLVHHALFRLTGEWYPTAILTHRDTDRDRAARNRNEQVRGARDADR